MKKTITWACLLTSAITILAAFRADEALLVFLLAGQLPVIDYTIPALAGVALYGTAFLIVTTALYQVLISRLTSTPRDDRPSDKKVTA